MRSKCLSDGGMVQAQTDQESIECDVLIELPLA